MPPPGDGTEPIDDDEIIFRRVPVSMGWYSPETGCSPQAFTPRPDDDTGICFVRQKYSSAEEAARGASKKGYWILRLKAGKLRERGIELVPRPVDGSPGHVELPEVSSSAVRDGSRRAEEIILLLAKELIEDGIGPFFPASQ